MQTAQTQQVQGAKITAHLPNTAAGQQQQVIIESMFSIYTKHSSVSVNIFCLRFLFSWFLQLIQLQQQVPGGVTQVLPSVATIVQAHSIQASRQANVSFIFFFIKFILNHIEISNEFNSFRDFSLVNFNFICNQKCFEFSRQILINFVFVLASTTATNRKGSDCFATNNKYYECCTTCSNLTGSTTTTGE